MTSPAFVVIQAADIKDKTTAPRMGLVLSEHNPGRLLALHHRLEAVHDDEASATNASTQLCLQ
jgi:hypothetical protein